MCWGGQARTLVLDTAALLATTAEEVVQVDKRLGLDLLYQLCGLWGCPQLLFECNIAPLAWEQGRGALLLASRALLLLL